MARRRQHEKPTSWPLQEGVRCGRVAPGARLCGDNWGVGAKRAVRRLIRLQGMRLGEPLAALAPVVWGRLAVAVAKGVAQCLLRAYPGFEAHVAEPLL